MTVIVYTAVMSLLISAFALVAAMLRSLERPKKKRGRRKKKYNLKK